MVLPNPAAISGVELVKRGARKSKNAYPMLHHQVGVQVVRRILLCRLLDSVKLGAPVRSNLICEPFENPIAIVSLNPKNEPQQARLRLFLPVKR
jgi:hypothetical protein